MSDFFLPYEGRKAFAFISYSHKDSVRVLSIIRPLHEMHYRVWYDEGIPAGGDWPKNIAIHMRYASAVLFFLSNHSLRSANCLNEIRVAKQQHKPILCIRLDDTPLTGEWLILLDVADCVNGIDTAAEHVAQAVLEHGTIDIAFLGDGTNDDLGVCKSSRFNGWMLVAGFGIFLFITTAIGTYGLTNHWFDACFSSEETKSVIAESTLVPNAIQTPPLEIDLEGAWVGMLGKQAVFPDEQQERAVRAAIDQPKGDVLIEQLRDITELHFCGNMGLKTDTGITLDSEGNWRVNSAPVMQGSISDLSLIADMLALKRLTLVCQQVESLAPLRTLILLTELNVAGNPLSSIGALDDMISLNILRLEHTGLTDLSALNSMPSLQVVTVSAEMFPLKLDPDTQRYDLVLVP